MPNDDKTRRFVDTRTGTRQLRIRSKRTPIGLLKRFNSTSALSILALTFGAYFSNFSVAQADLRVCNKTDALIGVSVGYRLNKTWMTEGWWRIPANICTSVIEGDLGARYFYLHAEDAKTGGQWQGPVFMCTSNKEFKIKGLEDCFARGFERTGFFEVDTGNQKSWQVQLTEANQTQKDEKSQ